MKNIFATFMACVKFIIFWLLVIIQIPILIIVPKGKLSVAYSRVFYKILMYVAGVRVKVNGKLSKSRPLLLVSNHISVFEMAVFPMALGTSFFGKAEIAKYPLVGWVGKKFGAVFISRNPRTAVQTTKQINDVMVKVGYPMTIFPEGTTNNGCFIYPFKSSMFDIVEKIPNLTIQPVVMLYRFRDGSAISDDRIMADNYSCPANDKIEKYNQEFGKSELIPKKERSLFGHVFHIMKIGGLCVELNL
ncbi:MAG: 1-acyl-sn-glycerol-3-phosphate acyltransferase, partial [Alphaproteobacteria bacterium]|nr:1-acyl-sn-glycerol-3-phosphate acyltransferase [Alphaproteobacteria bacterium]